MLAAAGPQVLLVLALKYQQSQKFKKGQSNWNPASIRYLVEHAWGCSNSYLCHLRKAQQELSRKVAATTEEAADLMLIMPMPHEREQSAAKSVIDDLELAERVFTTVYLYAVNECRRNAKDNLEYVGRKSHTARFAEATKRFENLDENTKEVWESKRRSHILRQPQIKDEIVTALKKNPKSSWRHIEKIINHWCCDSTIRRWLTSKEGYKLYAERVIPLLSNSQKKKHLDFSKRFRSNWGLGPGKYLLVHYDEKWFWGMVCLGELKSN